MKSCYEIRLDSVTLHFPGFWGFEPQKLFSRKSYMYGSFVLINQINSVLHVDFQAVVRHHGFPESKQSIYAPRANKAMKEVVFDERKTSL